MTSPSNTQDVPLAQVKIGPTEIAHGLAFLAAVLTVVFGTDWGLTQHIQEIAAAGAVLLPIALGLIRSQKHKAVVAANATVTAASLVTNQPVVVPDTGRHAADVGADLNVVDLTGV